MLSHFPHPGYRLKHWGVLATLLFALGWIISPFWAMNKQLWSPAYLFFMAGSCGYLLIAFYAIYDLDTTTPAGSGTPPMWQRVSRTFFAPCKWVGMNTIFIYLAAPSGGVFEHAQKVRHNSIFPLCVCVCVLVYFAVACMCVFRKASEPPLMFWPRAQWIYFNDNPDDTMQNLFHDYIFCEKVDTGTGMCTGHGIFSGHGAHWADLGWVVFRVAFWTCVAGCVAIVARCRPAAPVLLCSVLFCSVLFFSVLFCVFFDPSSRCFHVCGCSELHRRKWYWSL